jgi:hypothetical protein
MTARATFTQAQLTRAALVARETGVAVIMRAPDGTEVRLDPVPHPLPPADPFDMVDMKA